MILAGDIGGTKVNLALFQEKDGRLERRDDAKYESRKFSGLEEILEDYCKQTQPALERAGFGIAGPVKDGKCEVTNLPWSVDANHLKGRLDLDAVWLINDLAATACAVPFLGSQEVEVLQAGTGEADQRVAVLAAGTGLGEAFLLPEGNGRYRILDSEGGHCDFAPRTKTESDLLLYLIEKFGRASIERILSGPGLSNLYQFVKGYFDIAEPAWLTREFREGDAGEVITRNGLAHKSPACERALDLFVSIYGAVAGNLALQFLTGGGVFIGGGIAPKIISLMKNGSFLSSFLSKGRFQSYMSRVPVKVILNDKAALLGVAHYAIGQKFVR
ncbi:MAG: glucokinase [Nitrospinaceae bacterium]